MKHQSLEDLRKAAGEICQEIALKRGFLDNTDIIEQTRNRVAPLLTLCKQAHQSLDANDRPDGILHALGIIWFSKKANEAPWPDLFKALEYAHQEDGLYILGLINEAPSARTSPHVTKKIRAIVLNRPEWRIQAIEAYPDLFATKTERIQSAKIERKKTVQAPIQASEPSAPSRRCSGQKINLPFLEPATFSRNSIVTWMTTISMDERNDAQGLQGSRETIEALKAAGAVFAVDRKTHDTPLHAAANVAMPSRVRALCEAYPDMLGRFNAAGNPPLHLAIMMNSSRIVDAMMEGGCDPQQLNIFGQSPLDVAVSQRNAHITAQLLAQECIAHDEQGLKNAKRWIMGNLEDHEFSPAPKDQEVLALLQAAQARLAISKILAQTKSAAATV